MSVHVLNSNLILVDEVVATHNGQVDAMVKIGNPNNDEVYGYVEYSIFNNRIKVTNVCVSETYAKKGYATIMMNHIKRSHKGVAPICTVNMNQITNMKKPMGKKPKSTAHKGGKKKK